MSKNIVKLQTAFATDPGSIYARMTATLIESHQFYPENCILLNANRNRNFNYASDRGTSDRHNIEGEEKKNHIKL